MTSGSLKRLSVAGNNLTARGVVALMAASLVALDVSDNALGSDSGDVLAAALHTTSLHRLRAARCGFAGSTAETLGKALAASRLAELAVPGNPLHALGTVALAAAAAAPGSALRVLDVSDTSAGPGGCVRVAECLATASLARLDLSRNGCDTAAAADIAAVLRRVPPGPVRVAALALHGGGGDYAHEQGGRLGAAAGALAEACVALGTAQLDLNAAGVDDAAVPGLAAWIAGPHATSLLLDANRLTARGAAQLIAAAAGCARGMTVSIANHRLQGVGALLAGAGGAGLVRLNVASCALTAEDVVALVAAAARWPALRELDVRGNPGSTRAGVAAPRGVSVFGLA